MVHKKKQKPPVSITENSENGNVSEVQDGSLTRDRRARLIVRNLPFANLSEESVKKIFAKYGNIVEVNLLKKENGKYVGCGFVEFDNRQSAAKAIAHTNQTQIAGRPIIVDWALPKNTFIEKAQEWNNMNNIKKEEEDSDEDYENKTVKYSIDKKPNIKYPIGSSDDEDNQENDDDQEDNDYDDEDEEDEQPKRRIESNDVEEGTTVFIKNIPFSATNADLKNCVKSYGSIVHALICIDQLTEHSRGSAFVKFKEKESADNCIKDSQNIYLQDQPLEVTRAVSRSKLEEEKKLKKLKNKDMRNLYLVREGVVNAGSSAAVTVSAADMAKRLQIEQWKTQILRNLNMFVSKTRLVVHNVPADYDDAKLRKMMQENSSPSAVIKEARIMRNTKKMDSQGQPLSKEVGFVSYTSHDDALYALRKINNNPKIFTPNKRPILSFSIENREILNLKQKRLEKSKSKLVDKPSKELEKLTKKQRRFLIRKEKIIRLRQEAKQLKKEGKTGDVVNKKEKVKTPERKINGVESPSVKVNENKVKKTGKANNRKVTNLETQQAEETKNSNTKKKGKKRKMENVEGSSKKLKQSENVEDYGGVETMPGKKFKMRSHQKLRKQAEVHKQRLKEAKRERKNKKVFEEKKRMIREREPGMKKGKKKFDDDGFSKLINSYKKKIESAPSFKKWYDT